ncbi:MAG: ADP-glyceromanno-heptose 6-epimerase [Bacteroidales bacterium]|nr:ADP-glyceromanno-heptose 6-epimerase [Bacteroidales bacterium]
MIIVTGAAGFIGNCLVNKLNNKGLKDIILVDDFSDKDKDMNLKNKVYRTKIHRDNLSEWLEDNGQDIEIIYHIGARTDTAEFDMSILNKLNLNYSKMIWELSVKHNIPLVYASSAATYGSGELGYNDDHQLIPQLKPLNPYGVSENEFDKWVLGQTNTPPFWAGIKFFNVYGPNEYHKGRMASVVIHTFLQINKTGKMKLFKSHNPGFEDGMQLRDFIYVKDVVDVLWFLKKQSAGNGIYNLGTGKARTFIDLATAVFNSLGRPVDIEFIDIPADIRDKYQYYTEAKMEKLISSGFPESFYPLDEGVEEYVQEFLKEKRFY